MSPDQLLDEDVEWLELRGSQLNLCRQWFNAVQDLNPAYLTPADYQLAREIYEQLGMRVPQSVVEGCEK